MIYDAAGRALRRTIGFLPELVPVKEGSAEGAEIELISTEKIGPDEEIALEQCGAEAA